MVSPRLSVMLERGNVMSCLFLLIAGIFETGWAIGLKYSEGSSKPLPSVLTIVGMIASFYFLSLALKNLPLGTAYAIWAGIGTVGTVFLGVLLWKEPALQEKNRQTVSVHCLPILSVYCTTADVMYLAPSGEVPVFYCFSVKA